MNELPFAELSLDAITERAIAFLQVHQPPQPYFGCFSGGKDSCVIKELARMAGVSVEWHYHMTTIDPPEIIYYMREHHKDVIFDRPKHGNFFARMEKKGFPTRQNRWCCADYKEGSSPAGRTALLGVRAAESPRRAAQWQPLMRRGKCWAVTPILHWRDEDVWAFIRSRGLPYCKLYNEGFKRLGCIGCPMARKSGRLAEFARWPRFERLWKRSFQRIWERRTGTLQRDGRIWFGDKFFNSCDEMWEWWLSDESLPNTESDCGSQFNFTDFAGKGDE